MSTIEQRALEWAIGGDTGASSRSLMKAMLGQKLDDHWCHPVDNSDLGRCIRLLAKIPEWRPRVSEMAAVSPMWKALAANWDELERLYLDDPRSKKLYARMKEILDPIENRQGGFVRMGKHAFIRFGSYKP